MNYCPNCGTRIPPKIKYCPNCGKGLKPRKKNTYFYLIIIFSLLLIGLILGLFYARKLDHPLSTPTIIEENEKSDLTLQTPEPLEAKAFTDDSNAIQNASNSVVLLNCYDKNGELYATGSGFAAIEPGIIITNYHVIEGDTYNIKAQTERGSEFIIKKIAGYDQKQDIAILKADSGIDLALLPLGSTNGLEKGSKVVAIGSPLGLINSVSTGVYSGKVDNEGQDYLQFSAAISAGSSGGALFNDKGEVIGITSASYIDGQNLNLAIPIEKTIALWEKSKDKQPITIEQFYDSFDHIKTYDVDTVLANYNSFGNELINVVGYISSIDYGYSHAFLVQNKSDVLGYVFQAGAEWDYSDGNKQAADQMRNLGLQNIEIKPFDLMRLPNMNDFSPSDQVIVYGYIQVVTIGETTAIIINPKQISKFT